MRQTRSVLVFGVVLAVATFIAIFFFGTARHRSLERSAQPELAWMKDEFHLSDETFNHVVQLHAAYMPKCAEMCRRIDEKSGRLHQLLQATNVMTDEIKQALSDAAQVRQECQTAMLEHFYEVSRAMPPEEGKRYLAWVQRRTLGPPHVMTAVQHSMQKQN